MEEIDRLQHALSEAAEAFSRKLDPEEEKNLKQPDPPKTAPGEAVPAHDFLSNGYELGIVPQGESPPKCAHCGDLAVDTYKGEPICSECLEHGRILEEGAWDNVVSKLEDRPRDDP